jgi:integrase
LGDVARGGDPLEEKRKTAAASENTFKSVALRYLKHEAGRLRSIAIWESMLKRLVFPRIGDRPIDEIRRSEIVALLDVIADDQGPVQSDRTLSVLGIIMRWHARRDDNFRSPIVPGMARTKSRERARTRILTDDEIRALWNATDALTPFNALMRVLLLTGARRSEVSEMKRGELNGDLWTLPAARNKVKADLERPLSAAGMAELARLPNLGDMIFSHDGILPTGGFSREKAALDERAGVTGWVIHDLRRTSRSLMSRAGVSSDIAERCLGHVLPGVRGVYDRHRYVDEMRAGFEALAALIARIVDPPQENVVMLRG